MEKEERGYTLYVSGELSLHTLPVLKKRLENAPALSKIDLSELEKIDTAGAIFLETFSRTESLKLLHTPREIQKTIELVRTYPRDTLPSKKAYRLIEWIGRETLKKIEFIREFLAFIGMLFVKKFSLFFNWKHFRYKEILFEINQSGLRAVGIVALTSFLVGVVVAYQSAVQLKQYGANIFIVDMLGISILRELAPMITAIVIAGRSGSAYTAEIGAMKITEELDAMRTMGFDPYFYLVVPRIVALSIVLPILIFVADISGIFGGMIIAINHLDISFSLFLDRFREVVAAKHFIIGEIKGPFFAFLIATIAIFRGFMVKDDTQSIGKNTTKSVVESIFAVIVCDALFSVVLTNIGW